MLTVMVMEEKMWSRSRGGIEKGPIQVRVPSVSHLYARIDPSPLDQRDLDVDVADWIEEWAEEMDPSAPMQIEVILDDGCMPDNEQAVTDSIRNHFRHRAWREERQMAKLLRDGRFSLLVGLVALMLFTGLAHLIPASTHAFFEVLHEGALVMGWVAMWKPLNIFLYEWWPVRHEMRACRRLAGAEITFMTWRPSQPAPAKPQRKRGLSKNTKADKSDITL